MCEFCRSRSSSLVPQMPEKDSLLGYFAVSKDGQSGAVAGGLLVVNSLARPAEFHCCAPVCVNRSQEILYGQALEEFLIGDQICQALVQKMSRPPAMLLVEPQATLTIRSSVSFAMLCLEPTETDAAEGLNAGAALRGAVRRRINSDLHDFFVSAACNFPSDLDLFDRWLADAQPRFDLLEPFERIHLALEEARKAA